MPQIWVKILNEKGKVLEDKPLKKYRITGDENTVSHKGLPRLASVGGGLQRPLDFGLWGVGKYNPKYRYLLYLKNSDSEVIQRGSTSGNFIAVKAKVGNAVITFVHVNGHSQWAKGKTIRAGQIICQVAPQSQNGGYAVHLHIDAFTGSAQKPSKVTRAIVFYEEPKPLPKLKFLGEMNLRDKPSGKDIGNIAKGAVGQTTKVLGKSGGYNWYQIKFLDRSGAVAKTSRNAISKADVTNINGSKPSASVPPREPLPVPVPQPVPAPQPASNLEALISELIDLLKRTFGIKG